MRLPIMQREHQQKQQKQQQQHSEGHFLWFYLDYFAFIFFLLVLDVSTDFIRQFFTYHKNSARDSNKCH